ncbi:MAG: hypothetical protein KDN19_12375 [Verrucomicrobiae bacterium]|nr:hypothetical protein [Verrucomicrobiae bacterium]
MPRRASSGISVGQILGIGAALIGFLVAAVLLFKVVASDFVGGSGGGGRGLAGASSLPIGSYIDNGRSLGGNVYRFRGKVEETLKWTPDRGRLISVDASEAGNNALLPVLVPETFSSLNIDRGAEFDFVVRVDRDGLLVAEDVDQG